MGIKIQVLKLALPLAACMIQSATFSQDKEAPQVAESQKTFFKMRNSDFTKLIGGIQEGFRLNYNSEKANLEGSVAKELKPSGLLLQFVGSVGTTTNLTTLFDQKVLPTMSGSVTLHYLIKPFSKWFYDGSFKDNLAALRNKAVDLDAISTAVTFDDGTKSNEPFDYKEPLREKVITNKLGATDNLYTHKRFLWFNVTGKYDHNKYLFFDNSRSFASQFYEPSFSSWTGKIGFNGFFSWNKTDVKWKAFGWRPNFIYFTLSAQYGLGNNVAQLKKQTIHDISSSTTVNGVTRETVKTQTPYTGTFKEFHTLTPAFDFIFSPIRSIAVNVFGDRTLIGKDDRDKFGLANFGTIATGLYFYGNGTTSKVNIGVYYKWTTNNSTNETVGNFGLRTSIPIRPLE